MTKKELIELEDLLVEVQESDDKIEALESLYHWVYNLYRKEGKKKLGNNFRDDL